MYQPQVLEVDPHRIKFNALNPRKHGGEEYEALKASIQEIGIVQMPLVRTLPGGFYEVIDGEGRVSIAQELNIPTIKITSLGMVQDEEALTMLVTSNTVREFSFIARCKGIAELNKKGMTGRKIAKVLGMHERNAQLYVSFGYFPDDILHMIAQNPPGGGVEVKKGLFSDMGESGLYYAFQALLPLRQVKPGRDTSSDFTLDGAYDYSEVRMAVQKAIKGEIADIAELKAYVERRRREIFEQRFDQELQARLQAEKEAYERALQDTRIKLGQEAEEEAKIFYTVQIQQLEVQLRSLQERHSKTVADIAKKVDAEVILKKREKEILDELEKALKEREKLQELERKMKENIEKQRQKAIDDALRQQENEWKAEKKRRDDEWKEEQKKQETALREYWSQKDAQLRQKAEVSVEQMCAAGVQHLAESQQWLLMVTSPEVLPVVRELGQTQLITLLAQMKIIREIIDEATAAIRDNGVDSDIVSHEHSMNGKELTRHGSTF